MKNLRVLLLVLLIACSQLPESHARIAGDSAVRRPVLLLTRANSGEHVSATVGQTIQVDLESLAGAGYGLPQVSSPCVQYRNSVRAMPPNPGGSLPIFVFEAISVGEAEIRIPRGDSPGFAVTVEVKPSTVTEETTIRLDQSNTDDSGAGWTNLVNHAVQTFTPALPKLVRIEVWLVEANPGPAQDAVTLTLLDTTGRATVIAEKVLPADHTGWVSFVFSNSGLDVTPGEVYGIEVNGTTRFGWKYVARGYGRGEALFNGEPLLKGAHSSFLFKTFGTE
jgi:hypothetical protein